MSALVIAAGEAPVMLCTADLFETCARCGVVHHEDVETVVTADEWFAPLPRRHRSVRTVIAEWF